MEQHVELNEDEIEALYKANDVLPCCGVWHMREGGLRYRCPLSLKYHDASAIRVAQKSRISLACVYSFIGGWDGITTQDELTCPQCFNLGVDLRKKFQPKYFEE
jgi:hypothetical protein